VLYGTAGASMIPLWIAADEGLFTKHGLHVTLTLGNSTTGANAVISGSADLFMGEVTSAYQAEAQGVPMQIVATLLTKSINKFFKQEDFHSGRTRRPVGRHFGRRRYDRPGRPPRAGQTRRGFEQGDVPTDRRVVEPVGGVGGGSRRRHRAK
jgi:NMT1/THI5 like